MLQFMTKHAKYFYVFFFLIIISFIFFYMGGPPLQSGQQMLAKIKRETITTEEYWRTYENMRDFYRNLYKDKFTADMEKKLNLKEAVLSELVNEKVLLVSARDMGLKVGNRELSDSITGDSAFQRDGKFSRELYLYKLRSSRLTPQYYEAKKREELLVNKMRQLIESTVSVSPDDLPQIKGNDKLLGTIRDSIINSKKAQAVNAYVETMKKKYDVVVKQNLIS